MGVVARFFASAIIAMSVIAVQTSLSNLWWLQSIDMPVGVGVFVSTLLSDLIGMSVLGAAPIIAIVLVGLLIAFFVAFLIIKWTDLDRSYLYTLAGATALFAIVVLMPLAFYHLDLIAGARTLLGKCCLIAGGAVSGYFFAVTGGKINA